MPRMRKFDRYGNEIFDDGPVPDGGGVRVPVMLTDAAHREQMRRIFDEALPIRDTSGGFEGLHRNGFRQPAPNSDAARACDVGEASHVAYVKRLNDAWREPPPAAAAGAPLAPAGPAGDARAIADAAYALRCQQLANAWKVPPKVAA